MDKNVNYDEIISLLKNEFIETMELEPFYYEGVEVIIGKEQQFMYEEDFKPNNIYGVVRFGATDINFGSQVVPITLTFLSEQNNIELAQNLLYTFAQTYNLTRSFDNTIQQVYTSPEITSNFNLAYDGFKSIMFLSGTFIISKNANFYKFKNYDSSTVIVESYEQNYENEYFLGFGTTDEEILTNKQTFQEKVGYDTIDTFIFKYLGRNNYNAKWSLNDIELTEDISYYGIVCENEYIEQMDGLENKFTFTIVTNYKSYDIEKYDFEVPVIDSKLSVNIELDTQPFYNMNNFTSSVARNGTIIINLTTFLLNDVKLINDCLAICVKDVKKIKAGVNNTFKLGVIFKSGVQLIDDFKLSNFDLNQSIGNIPVVNLVFTN